MATQAQSLAAPRARSPSEANGAPAKLVSTHSLTADHAPTNTPESLLVEDMAKHHWLADRAIRLQADDLQVNNLPLFIVLTRYEDAKPRAFYKALATLLNLRKQTPVPDVRFVSPQANLPAPPREEDF